MDTYTPFENFFTAEEKENINRLIESRLKVEPVKQLIEDGIFTKKDQMEFRKFVHEKHLENKIMSILP
jgi:hypothetical protein